MSNRIDSILSKITDSTIRDQLEREIRALQNQRKFGLVFEHHLPEHVALPGVKVRRGLKVTLKDAKKPELLTVARIKAGVATCVPSHPADDEAPAPMEYPVDQLVVTAEFGDPIHPGLKPVAAVEGPLSPADAPSHLVINAENHHALQTLQWTHEESVSLVYVDPPYNTGNKSWQYNDHYVAEQDSFRHSKWLSFMERRLTLARNLLKTTGVIIVAIGDDEHHRLRMLMDQIFGAQNFISDVVWQGGRKNDSRYVSNGNDYMLIYAKNEAALAAEGIRWRDLKPGADEVLVAGAEAWEGSAGDPAEATKLLKAWFRKQTKDHPSRSNGNYNYTNIDSSGRVFYASDMRAPEARENRCRTPLIHPITGQECKVPPNGWMCEEATLFRLVAEDRIYFGSDHDRLPSLKKFLDESGEQVPEAIFQADRRTSSKYLSNVLGDKRFPFPKDHEVLMRWFRMIAPKDAVILDFFGGSGTTAEAVIRLNAEDGGTRQCILVTNNELAAKDDAALRKAGHQPGDAEYEALGVFHHVTRPRIETVVTGIRQDGTKYSDGLPGRVAFFDLEYLDANKVADDMAFAAINPLLWMRAGAIGAPPAAPGNDPVYVHGNYAVLRSMDSSRKFADALSQVDESVQPTEHLFAVTNSPSEFSRWSETLPTHLSRTRLYEHYLKTFEINTLETSS